MATALSNLEDKLQQLLQPVDPENVQYSDETFIDEEFEDFKQQGVKLLDEPEYSRTEAALDVNRKKNRYRDIIPFDKNRVRLNELDDDNAVCSDYINASIIKGASGEDEYIAAQGPTQRTVNDFWRMIWEYGIKVIVMACRERDGEKIKCSTYWPTEINETKTFGMLTVELAGEDTHAYGHHTVRRLRVTRNGETKTVIQHHYVAWPDHGIPKSMEPIINLIYAMRRSQDGSKSPILIHCSAGCGRTGTLIALDRISNMFDLDMVGDNLDIFKLCLDLRKQRMSMVQTKDQYEMIYRGAILTLDYKINLENNYYENLPEKPPVEKTNEEKPAPEKPASLRTKPPILGRKPTLKEQKMFSDNSSLAAQLMGDNDDDAPVQSPPAAGNSAPLPSPKPENSTLSPPSLVQQKTPSLPSPRHEHAPALPPSRQEKTPSSLPTDTSSKAPASSKNRISPPPAPPARESIGSPGKPARLSYENISLRRSTTETTNITPANNAGYTNSAVYTSSETSSSSGRFSSAQPTGNPSYTDAPAVIPPSSLVDDRGEVENGELPDRSQDVTVNFNSTNLSDLNQTYATIDSLRDSQAEQKNVKMRREDNDTYAYADPRALNKWSLQKIARGYEDVDIPSGAGSEYQDVEDLVAPPVPMKSRGAYHLHSASSTSDTSLNADHQSEQVKTPNPTVATLMKGIQGAFNFKGLGKKNKQQQDTVSEASFDINYHIYGNYNVAFPNKVSKPKGEIPTPSNLK